jgi:alginate O-acetyltransferase complex protein AlgI
MLFNSLIFLFYFPVVVLVDLLLPHKFRWLFLLVASYYFYMNWKPVYAMLLFITTLTTWLCGILLEKANDGRKKCLFLTSSLIINLGLLFVFKYFNFFNESVYSLLEKINIRWPIQNLDLLLPIGISFYTFQSVGYTIDVYRGDIKAEKHFGIYALFVSFFPQLLAGPIGRAKSLIPQFRIIRRLDAERINQGIKQMIWGYFMKLVVADRLALYVNATYNNPDQHNGTTLLIATLFFGFQIYCDFAGYSNIACGAARILGFELINNFNRPFLSRSIAEFWRKWHISFSSWIFDYIFRPLQMKWRYMKISGNITAVMVTFLVSGIWHGANWTFIIWGLLHGIYLSLNLVYAPWKKKLNRILHIGDSPLIIACRFLFTFLLVSLAWIFFKANNISDAFTILSKIFSDSGVPFKADVTIYIYGLFGILILLAKEMHDEFIPHKFKFFNSEKPLIVAFKNATMIALILSIGVFDGGQFIYFQF